MIYNPKEFKLEKTTIWSFEERGKWATHRGDYRGNCPPQVPRNLILKYTKENDIVLESFLWKWYINDRMQIIKQKRNRN